MARLFESSDRSDSAAKTLWQPHRTLTNYLRVRDVTNVVPVASQLHGGFGSLGYNAPTMATSLDNHQRYIRFENNAACRAVFNGKATDGRLA